MSKNIERSPNQPEVDTREHIERVVPNILVDMGSVNPEEEPWNKDWRSWLDSLPEKEEEAE